jgi:hypothetical protein
MRQDISSAEIYEAIATSIDGTLKNIDDKYGVINCDYLRIQSKTANKQTSYTSYDDYAKSILSSTAIDPDEYNLLKEVKLQCLDAYMNSNKDDRVITIEMIDSVGNEAIEGASNIFICSGSMHNYRKYITDDVAFTIFANKRIGGLVLTSGCAQEEIKMLQNPELIYLKLKQMTLSDDQAIIVSNVMKYNSTIGYGFDVELVKDGQTGYTETCIFMDATNYSDNPRKQYTEKSKLRDIRKCLIAWSNTKEKNIITGDWGCGAFKGDQFLKFMIQMYCARLCRKNLYYFSSHIKSDMFSMFNGLSVEAILNKILAYSN